MNGFVALRQVAVELGLDQSQVRERLRERKIRPHKVHANGPDGPLVVVLTLEEADRLRNGAASAAGPSTGEFYVIQLVPDLDPRRIKVGFSPDAAGHVEYLRAGAPTAVLLKAWPCRPCWAAAAFDCLSGNCRSVRDGVFDCDDLAECVGRGDALFALLPTC